MANIKKVYWDSCAWIGLLNEESDKLVELEYVWTQAQNGEAEIWTSTVSQLEVCKLASEAEALKGGGKVQKSEVMTEDNTEKIENLFNQPFVKRVTLDVEISSRARQLYRTTPGLGKAPDAAHLVSAMKWNISTFHTYDRTDLLKLSGKLTTDDGTEMEICEPDDRPEPDLLSDLDDD